MVLRYSKLCTQSALHFFVLLSILRQQQYLYLFNSPFIYIHNFLELNEVRFWQNPQWPLWWVSDPLVSLKLLVNHMPSVMYSFMSAWCFSHEFDIQGLSTKIKRCWEEGWKERREACCFIHCRWTEKRIFRHSISAGPDHIQDAGEASWHCIYNQQYMYKDKATSMDCIQTL